MATDSDDTRDLTLILARGAILAGLCRFVPVPFLDDILLRRAHRHLIASLLRHHGQDDAVGHLRPLYASSRGCLPPALYLLLMLPVQLVVKIVKKLFKTVFFFLTFRDAALQMGYALLLGRTVNRCLEDGRLPAPSAVSPSPREPTWQAADRARQAFEKAFAGSDWRMIRSFVAGVFRGSRGVVSQGRSVAFRLLKREDPSNTATDSASEETSEESRADLETLARKLADALGQQEVQEHLAEFDARFDAAFGSA